MGTDHKKWDAKYPEIHSYATSPFQGTMSQLRSPQSVHVLRSMLCAHTLVHPSAVQTVSPAPWSSGVIIIKFGKVGHALSVQEHKDRSLCTGQKNKPLWSVRVALRKGPISSYTQGEHPKDS